MIERGKKCIVIADSDKLNTARIYHIASIADIDYIVTEDSKIDYIKQNWTKYPNDVI